MQKSMFPEINFMRTEVHAKVYPGEIDQYLRLIGVRAHHILIILGRVVRSLCKSIANRVHNAGFWASIIFI